MGVSRILGDVVIVIYNLLLVRRLPPTDCGVVPLRGRPVEHLAGGAQRSRPALHLPTYRLWQNRPQGWGTLRGLPLPAARKSDFMKKSDFCDSCPDEG